MPNTRLREEKEAPEICIHDDNVLVCGFVIMIILASHMCNKYIVVYMFCCNAAHPSVSNMPLFLS